MPRYVTVYLLILTSLGWAVNLAAELLSKDGGDPAVHGVFTFVIGALYAVHRKTRSGKTPDPPEGDSGD